MAHSRQDRQGGQAQAGRQQAAAASGGGEEEEQAGRCRDREERSRGEP